MVKIYLSPFFRPRFSKFGYNGTFKITTDGVVFFLPNEYE